jgi:histidinol phosphatase-like PHP family hydrolase
MAEPSLFDVSCVVHVHTTYSDGTATVPEVLDAARASGADALLVTDHDSLGARRDGWEDRMACERASFSRQLCPSHELEAHARRLSIDRADRTIPLGSARARRAGRTGQL